MSLNIRLQSIIFTAAIYNPQVLIISSGHLVSRVGSENQYSPHIGLVSIHHRYATSASLVLSNGTWDISGLIRVCLQTSATKHHLWNPLPFIWCLPFIFFLLKLIPVFWIESCWVLYAPRYHGRMFMFLRADIIFLPPFPPPSSYFISFRFGICFRDHHTLFVFHFQNWDSISFWWNF